MLVSGVGSGSGEDGVEGVVRLRRGGGRGVIDCCSSKSKPIWRSVKLALGVDMACGTNDRAYRMTGFDAYETAWDIVSRHLWRVLGFNAMWFLCFFLGTVGLFIVCIPMLKNWTAFGASCVILLLVLLPLWEAANILRYRPAEGSSQRPSGLPVVRIIAARIVFLFVVGLAYLMFLLPGIYVHSRLSLYLPVLLRSSAVSPTQSLRRSWLLSRSNFVNLYSLWIAVVVSHSVALLPFGIGLLLRQPVNGLAKDLMFSSCSTGPGAKPAQPTECKRSNCGVLPLRAGSIYRLPVTHNEEHERCPHNHRNESAWVGSAGSSCWLSKRRAA